MVSIFSQVTTFFYSILGGLLIAFVYDLFRIKRKVVRTREFVVFAEDILFWILGAVIMFIAVYIGNDGEVRGFVFLGAMLGAVLYFLTLSKVVISILLKAIGIIKKIFKVVFKIITSIGNFFKSIVLKFIKILSFKKIK